MQELDGLPDFRRFGGCTAFGLFFVVVACIVVNIKDY